MTTTALPGLRLFDRREHAGVQALHFLKEAFGLLPELRLLVDPTEGHALAAIALLAGAPIAATIALPAPAMAATAGTLDDAVAALRGISTMRASFNQTDRNGQSVNGTMTLKRPGKIRFEYAKGVPLLIVSNGKSLTMIDYEVNQVQRWPIGN